MKKIIKESVLHSIIHEALLKKSHNQDDIAIQIIKKYFSKKKNFDKAKAEIEKRGSKECGCWCSVRNEGAFSLYYKKQEGEIKITEIEDAELHTDGIEDSCDLDISYINDKVKDTLNKLI